MSYPITSEDQVKQLDIVSRDPCGLALPGAGWSLECQLFRRGSE